MSNIILVNIQRQELIHGRHILTYTPKMHTGTAKARSSILQARRPDDENRSMRRACKQRISVLRAAGLIHANNVRGAYCKHSTRVLQARGRVGDHKRPCEHSQGAFLIQTIAIVVAIPRCMRMRSSFTCEPRIWMFASRWDILAGSTLSFACRGGGKHVHIADVC